MLEKQSLKEIQMHSLTNFKLQEVNRPNLPTKEDAIVKKQTVLKSIVNAITPRYIPFSKLVTRNEIKNCKYYLKSRGLLINKVNMTRLLGCNFFSVYNKLDI